MKTQCSHCTKWIVFCFAFFQKSEWGLGQRPISYSVFFLLAFSFALTVSKEKAVYRLDFITNQVDFFKKQGRTPDEGSPILYYKNPTVVAGFYVGYGEE